MVITIVLTDGSRQIIRPLMEGLNRFKGDPRSLALDLFGDRVESVSY